MIIIVHVHGENRDGILSSFHSEQHVTSGLSHEHALFTSPIPCAICCLEVTYDGDRIPHLKLQECQELSTAARLRWHHMRAVRGQNTRAQHESGKTCKKPLQRIQGSVKEPPCPTPATTSGASTQWRSPEEPANGSIDAAGAARRTAARARRPRQLTACTPRQLGTPFTQKRRRPKLPAGHSRCLAVAHNRMCLADWDGGEQARSSLGDSIATGRRASGDAAGLQVRRGVGQDALVGDGRGAQMGA